VLLALIFSKYVYLASLTSYYTFYLIHRFPPVGAMRSCTCSSSPRRRGGQRCSVDRSAIASVASA
jgi:hypothetical protein